MAFDKTNNRTIAKNTLFLYFNMMVSIFVSLYTSRVVLKVLGIEDFGIYQTVGGVVGLLSFLNSALATGSSRFLTFEMGRNDFSKLKKTFSTILASHLILALIIIILAETVGLWFVANKLVIPSSRMDAALIAYQFSIYAAVLHLLQVPYSATIISHEKMKVYAYIGVVDVVSKLLIVFALTIGGFDRLILYSILMCLVTLAMLLFYSLYCLKHFEETRSKITLDKETMRGVMSYSGWNLFANTALALNNYGSVILLNIFFSPGVVTARAVANQVNMAAYHFITNFRTAVTPQIVKHYAAENYDESKNLLLSSTKYSFYIMLLLALPIFLTSQQLLEIWLSQVPPYSVIFLQLTIVCSLFQVFDASFYTALYAKGQIRENALISPTVLFISFPVVYVLFRFGCSPVAYAWASLICYAVLALIVKPLLIIKIVNYSWADIIKVFAPCFRVLIVSLIIPVVLYAKGVFLTLNIFFTFFFYVSVSISCVLIAVWLLGLTSREKDILIFAIKSRFAKKIRF